MKPILLTYCWGFVLLICPPDLAAALEPKPSAGKTSEGHGAMHEVSEPLEEERKPDPFRLIYTTGVGYTWLKGAPTREAQTANGGPRLDLALVLDFHEFVSCALHYVSIDTKDLAPITEMAIDTQGDVSDIQSSIDLNAWAPSIGLRTPLWCFYCSPHTASGAFAYSRIGYAWLGGERTVACSGCSREKLEFDGGPFVEVGGDLGFRAGDGWGISLFVSYWQHMGSGVVLRDAFGGLGVSYF